MSLSSLSCISCSALPFFVNMAPCVLNCVVLFEHWSHCFEQRTTLVSLVYHCSWCPGNPGIALLWKKCGMALLDRANCFKQDNYREQLDWWLQGDLPCTVDVSIFLKFGSFSILGMFCLVVFPVLHSLCLWIWLRVLNCVSFVLFGPWSHCFEQRMTLVSLVSHSFSILWKPWYRLANKCGVASLDKGNRF